MPKKSLNIKGVEWEYETAGRGREALLLFHDSVGGAETVRGLAEGFADEFRTIAPTVADVETLAEVCDAASAILDREHVARAHVLGGSFGGLLAQAFLKRRPSQVETLTLLGAAAPDPGAGARARRMSRLVRLLPFPLTRSLLKLELSRGLGAHAPPEAAPRVEEFRRGLDEYFDRRLTKRTMLSRAALSVDFNLRESYAPEDLAGWPGRVLIIESEDDPATPAAERRRLRETYPRALVCAFAGAGQMVTLLRPDALAEVVKAFIKEDYSSPSDIEDHCPADHQHEHAARDS
ncbi:MAG TPA: alpha/beta hydrolase [Pyrinomonadaceae bacterium]|jgi:pimeloyl-ACP methyl ester carboxylesterase|nr:alpha/beta hydrolase [Pyrinomonadaceae bacterium]